MPNTTTVRNSRRTSVAAALALALAASAEPLVAHPAETAPPSPYFELGRSERIQWRPWGEAAFREAQEKGLPVVLDIGAMWCHYCRVMSTTTWSDPGVAEAVNPHFLPIKVDRDEHPEVDARFQAILLEIRNIGGWPLTGFLTEEGRMFAGATYLGPEEDPSGRPGMKMAAERYGKSFQGQKRGYNNTAEEVASRFIQAAGQIRSGRLEGFADEIAQGVLKGTDELRGGFGRGAKFPEHAGVRFALERGARGDPALLAAALRSLDGMADGGIRDLLGGGFFRATVDREWHVPRFEKLAAVNAGLLELYAEAFRLTGSQRYRRIASETLDYLLGTLADTRAGGFYTAQAADRDSSDNGSTYTWTLAEVRARLSGDAQKVAVAYFDLRAEPGQIAGRPADNVLAARKTIEGAAAQVGLKPERAQKALTAAIVKLKQVRATRPVPPVDRSMYASINGLVAHALLVAGPELGRPDAGRQALATLDLFLARAWNDKTGFARGLRAGAVLGDGLLQDQVDLALALVDAYEATGSVRYRDAAVAAMDLAFSRFEDRAVHRLLDLPAVDTPSFSALVIPDYPVQDTMVPGDNAVASLVLARLERVTGVASRLEAARLLAESFAGTARGFGPNGATLGFAVDAILDPPPRLVVVSAAGSADAERFVAAVRAEPRRPAVLRFTSKDEIPGWLRRGALGRAIETGSTPFAALGGEAEATGPFADAGQLEAALRGEPGRPAPEQVK